MKIIAEVGSNWKTPEDCIRSIAGAQAAGADYVKFQSFSHRDLYGVDGPRACLPDIPALARFAKEKKIGFMCTAFSPTGYAAVNPHVKVHKVASSEITDPNILRAVNSFRKPVILSSGGATADEIDAALFGLRSCKVTLLYCVVAYPARIVDFDHLEAMKAIYKGRCGFGYSDHSTDVLTIPRRAQELGCSVIEKHVNFTDHTDTPDAPHSLNFKEFKLMVKAIRGEKQLSETFQENPYKRKAVAEKDGSLMYYRPQ